MKVTDSRLKVTPSSAIPSEQMQLNSQQSLEQKVTVNNISQNLEIRPRRGRHSESLLVAYQWIYSVK